MIQDSKTTSVMLIEDSPVVQQLLIHSIESDPSLRVISVVDSGEKAIETLPQVNPDVLVVDIFLPKMNGYELTKKVMATHPIPIVIVSGLFTSKDVDKTFKAIEAGALVILSKPTGPNDPYYATKIQELNRNIKLVSSVKLITRRPSQYSLQEGNGSKPLQKPLPKEQFEAVAIGSSLGGPLALRAVFSTLPSTFPLPIFAVQHISPGFLEGMVKWLQKDCKLPIKICDNGEKICNGTIYFAPDNTHMVVSDKQTLKLIHEVGTPLLQPSVSRLFQSVADVYGKKSVGVILTGMGRDGAQEMVMLKRKGAMTIAQDEATSTVFGMPFEAIRLGGVEMVLPVEEISKTLISLVMHGGGDPDGK